MKLKKSPPIRRLSLSGMGQAAKVLSVAIIVLFSLIVADRCIGADQDHDGLSDDLEQQLLEKHRPILLYDHENTYWPMSISEFVEHSALEWGLHQRSPVYTQAQLAADPTLIFRGDEVRPGDPSDVSTHPGETEYLLDIDDNLRHGNYPRADGSAHTGMYGHVVPFGGFILLQYWQFFPFNYGTVWFQGGNVNFSDCGDHEGDWLWIDVWLVNNAARDYPVQWIVWHHHGDDNCAPCWTSATASACGGTPQGSRLQDWTLDAGVTPLCFLEPGNHEWWPYASRGQECTFYSVFLLGDADNASHRGDGISYMVPFVPNVGEIGAPMPGSLEARFLLDYNGHWGAWGSECSNHFFPPPDSPLYQFWPSPRSLAWLNVVKWVDFGHNGGQQGTSDAPYNSLAAAVSVLPPAGKISIKAGSTSETLTIKKPVLISAVGGMVSIGQ